MTKNLVVVGEITSPHGVQGLVKVRHFCEDDESFLAYKSYHAGDKEIRLSRKAVVSGAIVCRVEGVNTRTEAEQVKGTKLYIDRNMLPKPDDGEFYYHDIIGMKCIDLSGVEIGLVTAIHNFGASDIIEIKTHDKKELLFAFNEETFPTINFEERVITLDAPEEV